MTGHILIADDDRELCKLLRDYLQREGYSVEFVHEAASALLRLRLSPKPDLLILDVMMPGKDGLTTVKELRQHHQLPVLMLSARGEPVDRVIGLELGADDYLAKPCLPQELLARVRILLRRTTSRPSETVLCGTLQIDPSRRLATIDSRPLHLTSAEYLMLLALVQQAGTPVNKTALSQAGLGRQVERFDRSVDVHVSRLRQKLLQASTSAPGIEAIRGLGYVLVENAK